MVVVYCHYAVLSFFLFPSLPQPIWEIGKAIQIIRAPVNIAAASVSQKQIKRQSRPRILAI